MATSVAEYATPSAARRAYQSIDADVSPHRCQISSTSAARWRSACGALGGAACSAIACGHVCRSGPSISRRSFTASFRRSRSAISSSSPARAARPSARRASHSPWKCSTSSASPRSRRPAAAGDRPADSAPARSASALQPMVGTCSMAAASRAARAPEEEACSWPSGLAAGPPVPEHSLRAVAGAGVDSAALERPNRAAACPRTRVPLAIAPNSPHVEAPS
mmetsp:Transcript_14097/g.48581  ORF Transcript_14097/g.48581 Transcript_14097/m.48581 type:complete len:221 (+) Transcript_14097:264-926(+)